MSKPTIEEYKGECVTRKIGPCIVEPLHPRHAHKYRFPAFLAISSVRPPAVIDAREAKLRSDWVRTMEARLVREELAKCWREEGVNHYQSCHALAEKYLDMIRTHRVSLVSAAHGSISPFVRRLERRNTETQADLEVSLLIAWTLGCTLTMWCVSDVGRCTSIPRAIIDTQVTGYRKLDYSS